MGTLTEVEGLKESVIEHKIILCLETSVVSAYYNPQQPLRQRITRQWWKKELPKYKVFVTEVTLAELEETPNPHRSRLLLKLVQGYPPLLETPEALRLWEAYLEEGFFPKEAFNDALHLAIATVGEADYLVIWNFTHLVNEATRQMVEKVNSGFGYPPLRIVSPLELGGAKYGTVV